MLIIETVEMQHPLQMALRCSLVSSSLLHYSHLHSFSESEFLIREDKCLLQKSSLTIVIPSCICSKTSGCLLCATVPPKTGDSYVDNVIHCVIKQQSKLEVGSLEIFLWVIVLLQMAGHAYKRKGIRYFWCLEKKSPTYNFYQDIKNFINTCCTMLPEMVIVCYINLTPYWNNTRKITRFCM